ncbi:MAG TPA: DUF305 domain-containing protein [Pseudolabrys sp.]
MSSIRLSLAICALLAVTPALAQHAGMSNMGGMDKGLMDSMTRMNDDMPKTSAGSVDADFVKMMIPHHQAAIDMAKVELAKGKDPAMRKLARNIIAAQEKEIAMMKGWLKKHNVH